MTTDNTSIMFCHPTLTALPSDQDPKPQDIHTLKKEVHANLKGIHSTWGGGMLGHLALMLTPAEYLQVSNNIPFIAPVHTGNAPVHAAGATQFQINKTNCQYQANLQEFDIYHKVQILVKTGCHQPIHRSPRRL